ncbi:MAG: hypothetical protein GX567_06950 [Clostridia bacterium]|nr:hypothetical protein [Clostridia bacterium]
MEFKGVTHIGMTVKNIDKSIEFYRDILGLKVFGGPTEFVIDEADGLGMGVDGAESRICMVDLGNGQAIEMMEFKAPPYGWNESLPPNALSHHHITLKVDDIHNAVNELKEKGVEVVYKPQLITEGVLEGIWWAYIKDPDGIITELMEFTKDATFERR